MARRVGTIGRSHAVTEADLWLLAEVDSVTMSPSIHHLTQIKIVSKDGWHILLRSAMEKQQTLHIRAFFRRQLCFLGLKLLLQASIADYVNALDLHVCVAALCLHPQKLCLCFPKLICHGVILLKFSFGQQIYNFELLFQALLTWISLKQL